MSNSPNFQPGGVVTETARIFADRIDTVPVEENRRAFALPAAMNNGALYPDFQTTGSPPPYPVGPAAQPAVTGAPRLPSGPRRIYPQILQRNLRQESQGQERSCHRQRSDSTSLCCLPVPDGMASYRGRGPASPRRYKICTATPRSHHAGCSAPIAFATASSPTTFLLERPEDQAQRREVHGASCPRASVVG
jgi:hypothetical protein